ncbi:MAG: hypothetical protein AAF490_12480 [Chloroflexota bacterium]
MKPVLAVLFVLLVILAAPEVTTFTEDWTGSSPDSPASFLSHPTGVNWDITSHARNGHSDGPWGQFRNFDKLPSEWEAHHTETCSAPPGTHTVQEFADTVFICREHMMTSTFGPGAAQVVLTPNHFLDLSDEEAVVRFDISTLRTAGRDYWQVNLTPLLDHQQLVSGAIVADFNGFPRNSIMINLKLVDSTFGTSRAPGEIDAFQIDNNFVSTALPPVFNVNYDDFLEPDAARRDTLEIKLTNNRSHLSVCMPVYSKCFFDTDLYQPFPSDLAVVQFSHHSYNPYKNCSGSALCAPNTYHWDNFHLEPTIPFTIIKADQYSYQVPNDEPIAINFSTPAPANSRLRFTAMGEAYSIQVSYDNGITWQTPAPQPMDTYDDGAFWPYFTGDIEAGYFVPEGTTSVLIRGRGNWLGDFIVVRDISLWSMDSASISSFQYQTYLPLIAD